MRYCLAISVAISTLASACSVSPRPPSTVQLSDLTTVIADNVARYEAWVTQDQLSDPFLVGLCLEQITAYADLTDGRKLDGSAGLPLAAPGAPVGGALSAFMGQSETEMTALSVPFVPAYPLPRVAAESDREREAALAAKAAKIDAWRQTLEAPEKADQQDWALPPANIDEKTFAQDDSLAAELWRIRAAVHYPVFLSAASGPTILRPTGLTFDRTFIVEKSGGGRATLSLASGASFGAGAERSSTTASKFEIVYVPNESLDPFACDSTSLTPPPA